MELINNRYRVIKIIEQNHLVISYLVNDMIGNHKPLCFNIINTNNVPKNLIDFLINEFIRFKGTNSSGIINLIQFGLITNIDNTKLKEFKYFYSTEYFEGSNDILGFSTNLSEEKKLELFIEVSQAINTLHLKGCVYGGIKPSNIFINDILESKIKLKDIATIHLEKHDFWKTNIKDALFRAPELGENNEATTLSDIYSLGIFLSKLFQIDIYQAFNGKKPNKYIGDYDLNYGSRLLYIIEKMTRKDPEDRYLGINQVIIDINYEFNKHYISFKLEDMEKLNFKTKLAGMEDPKLEVLNVIENMKKSDMDAKLIGVHGEAGIGKTRFLKEINHLVKTYREIMIFAYFDLSSAQQNSNKALVTILKKMISVCDKELLEQHEEELIKLIPELGDNKNITASAPLLGDKEKFRLLNRLTKFISDFVKGSPTVFIIDNIHSVDSFFIELLEYLHTSNLKNLLTIFSCDDSHLQDEVLSMIKNVEANKNYIKIKLNPLNEEELQKMIKNILSMPHIPVDFSKRIFEQTYGNPLFAEELIKNLYSEKEIYVDRETGYWKMDYEMFEDLPIPLSLEQAMRNQVKDIDIDVRELLITVSVFNNPISIQTISKVISREESLIEQMVSELVKRSIISRKIDDKDFVFDFYNKLLKKLIYDGLDKESKRVKHEHIASVLEDFDQYDNSFKEELIYHLEMAGEKNKVVKYCIDNADKFEKLNIRERAIKSLEKALSMIEDGNIDNRRTQMLIRLGDLYKRNGDIDNCEKYYQATYDSARYLKDNICEIDTLIRLATLNFNKNNIDTTVKYIEVAEKAISGTEYSEGSIEINLLWIKVYNLRDEYDKAFIISKKSLDACGNNYPKLKGRLLRHLGVSYKNTSKLKEAMECYEASIKCFEEINYLKGTLSPLNNIGVIYGDNLQDEKKAMECFQKMKEISEKNNFVDSEIMALINIGEGYFNQYQYEEASKYFKDALEKAHKIYREKLVLYSYIILTSTNLILYNYKEAYDYFEQTNEEILNHPEQGRIIIDYYRVTGTLFYEFGDIEKAKTFTRKALERYGSEELTLKWNTEILNEFINLREEDHISNIKKICYRIQAISLKIINSENSKNIIYNMALELEAKGHLDIAWEWIKEYIIEEFTEDRIKLKALYFQAIFDIRGNKLALLNRAVELAIKVKDKNMHWKICTRIGDYYFEKKSYFHAVNFYFDACEIIKGLVLTIPEMYRIGYMNFHFMKEPFNKLFQVKQYYMNIYNETQISSNIISGMEELKSIFEYADLKDMLTNKSFMKFAQGIYDSINGNKIEKLEDIISSMHSDPLVNIEIILKYLSSITLAKKAFILSTSGRDYSVLVAVKTDMREFDGNYIIEKVRSSGEGVLITESNFTKVKYELEVGISKNKAIICIPISTRKNMETSFSHSERRNTIYENRQVIGYLYLETDKVLNNFSEDTYKISTQLCPLLGFIIEKHQLKISSSIDKLTGTLTRKLLDDALVEEINKADLINSIFSIIMLDIDDFKGVNDRFGHQTGDEVLRKLCHVILSGIRKIDNCGRYGGEEFIIILPGTDSEGTRILAEKFRKTIEKSKILNGKREITVSMGIATYPVHGSNIHELIEKADQALYVAKESGRNRSQVWQTDFSGKVKGNNKLTGIISGNPVQDYRNVSVMVELVELIKEEFDLDKKIFEFLGRIIESTEAQMGTLFLLREDEITSSFSRRAFEEGWSQISNYNKNLLRMIIDKKQGAYLIDWDEISEFDSISGMPDWKSIIIAPLLKSGSVIAVLYLTASTKLKEFKLEDYNFVNVLGQLAVAML